MTVIMPLGRAFARQTIPQTNYLLTRLASSNHLLRASRCNTGDPNSPQSHKGYLDATSITHAIRKYATAAASKPVGRPKAHTGRVAAKKSAPKAKVSTTKKQPATKTKARAKPRVKSKTKAKPKTRAAKVPPSKSALNKARLAKTKDLKTRALLNEPKQLPDNAYTVYFSQKKTGVKTNITDSAANTKEVAQNYKTLSPEEREQLNHIANQNKAKNEAEYKKWLSQHTPAEIKEANHARKLLSNEKKVKEGKKKSPVRRIKDERLVKRPKTSYLFFHTERFASGDFKHMTIAESAGLIGKEWKALSASEKKPYEDQAEAEMNRYHEEYRTVYGQDPALKKASKASTT